MIAGLLCALLVMGIVAGLVRVARLTGAGRRHIGELEYNAHEFIALNRPGFYQERKWAV